VSNPGFIKPPPDLIPPRHDTGTQTQRAPQRKPQLPAFRPQTAHDAAPASPEREPRWRITLPTDAVVEVERVTLLGRNPVRFGQWAEAELIVIDDPARSVSKTHAAFEPAGQSLRVTDVHSTNGVYVTDPSGTESRVPAGDTVEVQGGSQIHLGSYTVNVSRA
jgi:hypothetical protein